MSEKTQKPAERFAFPKEMHLRKSREFQLVFRHGQRHVGRIMIVFRWHNKLGHPRLGLVVSRKAGKSVRRNRIKRLLREAFRLNQEHLPANDIVVIPRPGFLDQALDAIQRELVYLCNRPSRPPRSQARRD